MTMNLTIFTVIMRSVMIENEQEDVRYSFLYLFTRLQVVLA